ncbi:MAG: polymer-forming cytoskeletal protein [Planctomycetes bacterium]|nr:polymer-forming cytoskeletal protein [Planctomycetota bacterium]
MSDPNSEYPTVIGADASIKGELRFEKGMHLLGKFEGEIESKGVLLVAEGASLSGDVKAGTVKIEGVMTGNLEATGKVKLSASARLEGDLRTARLEVADGAMFSGHVVVGAKDSKTNGQAASAAPKGKAPASAQPAMAGKR